MDDNFMKTLKSFSVQDLLDDQRPTTSRLLTARGGRRAPPVLIGNGFLGGILEKKTTAMKQNIAGDEIGQNKLKTGGGGGSSGRVKSSWGIRTDSSISNNNFGITGSLNTNPMTISYGDETVDFIPDLSDIEESDFAMSIASAPRVEFQKITSLSELDAELKSRKAFSNVRNVDLRKLTKYMCHEKDLIDNQILKGPIYISDDPDEKNLEEIKNYMYDTLFTDISTKFDEKQKLRGSMTHIWDDDEFDDEELSLKS